MTPFLKSTVCDNSNPGLKNEACKKSTIWEPHFALSQNTEFIQGHPTSVFCKISIRRSKYCLEFCITWERLKISRWSFLSCKTFWRLSRKFPTIFWSLIFPILLPRLSLKKGIKVTPLPKLTARVCALIVSNTDRACFQSVCGETLAPYHRKGDWSRRGFLLAERKCMKRWRSGWLKKESDPYTLDNVSSYKRGLKWLTGNRYRDLIWPKYWLSQFILGTNGFSVWIIGVIRFPCTKCIKSCASLVRTELTSFWEESHKEGNAYIMGIVHSHELAFLQKCNIRHFHISHNAPYLPPENFA